MESTVDNYEHYWQDTMSIKKSPHEEKKATEWIWDLKDYDD